MRKGRWVASVVAGLLIAGWSARISAALLDRQAAFETAAAIRRTMAVKRTWAQAVAGLTDVCFGPDAGLG